MIQSHQMQSLTLSITLELLNLDEVRRHLSMPYQNNGEEESQEEESLEASEDISAMETDGEEFPDGAMPPRLESKTGVRR